MTEEKKVVEEKVVEEKQVLEAANEFDNLGVEDEAPNQENSDVPTDSESILDNSEGGQEYDYKNAPDDTRAPPRVNMDGKEVVITKAVLKLPAANREWDTSKSGKAQYKYCSFKLYYDFEGQQETVAGIRVFKRENNKCSHPSIMRDRVNQSSRQLGLYADFKGKDINEIPLSELMGYLNTNPKVKIKCEVVKNPVSGVEITKNLPGEYLPQ